jgi:hypothetical protein
MNTDRFFCILFGLALLVGACSTSRNTNQGEMHRWEGGVYGLIVV